MTAVRILTALTLTTAALSGCAIKQAAVLGADLTKLNVDYAGAEATASRDLPTGTATYEGVAVLGVQSELISGAVMLGDAELTADFDSGKLSGEVTDFVGLPIENAAAQAATVFISPSSVLGDLKRAEGSVSILEGEITAGALENELSGTVTLDGVAYGVGGTVEGEVIGDAGEALRLEGDEETLDLTADGEVAEDGLFKLIAGAVE